MQSKEEYQGRIQSPLEGKNLSAAQ